MKRHLRFVVWLGLLLAALTLRSAAVWALETGNNLLAIVAGIVCAVFTAAWCFIGLLLMVDDE